MSEPGELWGHDDSDKNEAELPELDGVLQLNETVDLTMYRIDPTKIKTIEDVARVIGALDIRVNRVYHKFDEIEDLLTKEDDDDGLGR
jgi:butyrate kinase